MKKRGPIAIVLAVLFSILLFPFIYAFGLCSGAIMATSSWFEPGRKEEVYQNFVADDGIDWLYEVIDGAIEEGVMEASGSMEDVAGLEQIFENLITRDDVETIVKDVYDTVLSGEVYQFDFSVFSERLLSKLEGFADDNAAAYIEENLADIYAAAGADVKDKVKEIAKEIFMEEAEARIEAELAEVSPALRETSKKELLAKAEEEFEAQADAYIAENIEMLYAQLDEETKEALIAEAKEVILPEFQTMMAEEVKNLEESLNTEIANLYETSEYKEFMAIQEQYGVSIFDMELIHSSLNLSGYLFMGLTFVFIVLVLLSHLFRPSGFYVAGVYTVLLGALQYVIGSLFGGRVAQVVSAELAFPHASLDSLVHNFLAWFGTGFTSVGIIFLCAGAALILGGILITIINKNKAVQEA